MESSIMDQASDNTEGTPSAQNPPATGALSSNLDSLDSTLENSTLSSNVDSLTSTMEDSTLSSNVDSLTEAMEDPPAPEIPTDDGFVHIDSSPSQKDTAVKALSSIIKSEQDNSSIDGDWVALSSPALKVHALGESTSSSVSSAENSAHAAAQEGGHSRIISYSRLSITSTDPALDVDPTKRESYLSEAEFQSLFGMSKSQFYALPKWKQAQRKLNLDLF